MRIGPCAERACRHDRGWPDQPDARSSAGHRDPASDRRPGGGGMNRLRALRRWFARRPLVIWVIGVGCYLLAVFHRTSLGVAGPLAAERLNLSAGQLSTFVMLQLGVYAAMQVPAGILIDRFG